MTHQLARFLCHQRDAQLATLTQCVDDVLFGAAAVRRIAEGRFGQEVDSSSVCGQFRADGKHRRHVVGTE
ncbi:hypothetical protein D3C71_1071990 [compost metagenome]